MTIAFTWIRDGVLIDRMPVNAAAFAIAFYLGLSASKRKLVCLEDLVDFAFLKSGISCFEKMTLFNTEVCDLLVDVPSAAAYYDKIAAQAGARASYFSGAPQLLCELAAIGKNYITSAVEQSVLYSWSKSEQGMVIAPYLSEILGRREGFIKGRDHFFSISIACQKNLCFSDAVAEVKSSREYAREFNITPVGFANVITVEAVKKALSLVLEFVEAENRTLIDTELKDFDSSLIRLPDSRELVSSLRAAGASHVVTGSADEIFGNLRHYLVESGVLDHV